MIVRIDSWQTNHASRALIAIALLRFGFRKIPGLTFYKILGTGKGETFTVNDADPSHWVLLTTWNGENHKHIEKHLLVRALNSIAASHRQLLLKPISTRGTWAKASPFIIEPSMNPDAAIAVITRARIKVRWWRYFYSQVPPVIIDLQRAEGLQERFGIGEAPVGLQGTFSIWKNHDAIKNFAYQTKSHQEVIQQTSTHNWYAEELFARFEILSDVDVK
ncbi:MAG: hypothetical protein ACO3XJ_05115 [Candidatus Nanopelagicales bacterium]